MPIFKIVADYISTDEFEVEAENADAAKKRFMNGCCEHDEGHNVDYTLNEIKTVEEIT